MSTDQHKFFNTVLQSVADTRAGAHEVAWAVLGLLLISAILALGLLSIWILRGGFSRYCTPGSPGDRRAFEDWV